MRAQIAYTMSRFPHLPETFILREMIAMENLGWKIALYPLIVQEQPVIHAEAEEWVKRAHDFPWFSSHILKANLRQFILKPRRYLALLGQVIWENRSSLSFLLRSLLLYPKIICMAEKMQHEGVAHIHAHYATYPALAAWLIHHIAGISYSVTVHAHDIFVNKAMMATKLHEASFIVAISDYNRDTLRREVGMEIARKTHVVHCGIDPAIYTSRAEPRTGHEVFEIISVGSLKPYKGMRFLIEACVLLQKRGVPFHCQIIGDGEERPGLQRMITKRGLGSHVELLGARTQTEVARLMLSAHCYAQPSVVTPSGKMEGIPVSIMEAFASGLPVVATEISGIPELVHPGETGCLVPPADPLALADALVSVYQNPVEAARMAKAGQTLVATEFNIIRSALQLSALFEQCLSGQHLMD